MEGLAGPKTRRKISIRTPRGTVDCSLQYRKALIGGESVPRCLSLLSFVSRMNAAIINFDHQPFGNLGEGQRTSLP